MDVISFSDWMVVIASFITPLILLPQIIRLIRLKSAQALSLLTLLGSLFLQVNIFINAYVHAQPQLMVSMALSIIPLTVVVVLVLVYRKK